MNQQKFSLAVSGEGRLMTRFVRAVKVEFRNVNIYDRNEEARRPPSTAPIPSHPKVADVDVIFTLSGSTETATIRSRFNHRFFNYESGPLPADDAGLEFLLKRMVQAVWALLSYGMVEQ